LIGLHLNPEDGSDVLVGNVRHSPHYTIQKTILYTFKFLTADISSKSKERKTEMKKRVSLRLLSSGTESEPELLYDW
jgi:hypothetical protein